MITVFRNSEILVIFITDPPFSVRKRCVCEGVPSKTQKGGRNEEILSGSQRRARGMHARGDHSPPGNERQRDAGIPAPKRNIRRIPAKRDPVTTANTWKTCNTISYGNKTERGFEHERVCNTENDRGNICSK